MRLFNSGKGFNNSSSKDAKLFLAISTFFALLGSFFEFLATLKDLQGDESLENSSQEQLEQQILDLERILSELRDKSRLK